MSATFRISMYTGPVLTDAVRHRLAEDGAQNAWDGTERVYWTEEADSNVEAERLARERIERLYGPASGFRVHSEGEDPTAVFATIARRTYRG